jgi:hypothetical protein
MTIRRGSCLRLNTKNLLVSCTLAGWRIRAKRHVPTASRPPHYEAMAFVPYA